MNRHQSGTHTEHSGREGKFPLVTDLRREKRSQDIAELGQFAPGGNYNQPRASSLGRLRLAKPAPDDEINKSEKKN